ncbi:hypothetical protein [Leifsonia sp. TF02-11]|uniref:hypothetical protein n=1 Tax=Leifsonia sp. TF02-11 TaxID=2815212 RepID=UPI001AA0F1F3|nr:hypothetical protein [Leifsonia sp. TF02-11]MBO1740408.1 hypothetical protein [Leifsonia sp. TF02-11]
MKTLMLRTALLISSAAALISAAGCTPAEQPGGKLASTYVALIEAELASGNLTDFETDVLTRARERGSISQSDYEAAHTRYKECMASKGIVAQERRYPNGIIHSTPPGPDDSFTIDDLAEANFACGVGTTAAIDQLYSVQQGNPDLLRDRNEAGAACLVREGIAPVSFSREDFAATFDGPGSDYSSLPFDVHDDRVHMCLYVAGIVIRFTD